VSLAGPGRAAAAALPASLGPRAAQLLVGVSVYREPADSNAVVFQLGDDGSQAGRAADQSGLVPPCQPPADLSELLAACTASGLLHTATRTADGSAASWQADPRVAGELYQRVSAAGRPDAIVSAHRRAAGYWQWRATAWPQDRRSDVHDLLEARYHLFRAGDTDLGSEVTRSVCAQLHAWGDLDREAELITSTLEVLPAGSASRASWLHELGTIHQVRGEFAAALRCYAGAVELSATLGDYRGVSRGQHSLGVLAQAQGDYRRAERHYKRSAAAERKAAGGGPRPGATAAALDEPGHAPASRAAASALEPAAPMPAPAASRATGSGQPPAPAAAPATDAPRPAAAPATDAPRPAATAAVDGGRPLTPAPPRARAPARAASGRTRSAVRLVRGRSVLLPAVIALGLALLTAAGLSAALARPAGRPVPGGRGPATAAGASALRTAAAAWVARQVSPSAVVACDPAECAALHRRGLPAGDLLTLGPGGPADPLASDVIVATAAVRAEFGTRLATVYAPDVLASFGAGPAAIQVRIIAPDGAAAYLRESRADLDMRRRFGSELLRNAHLAASGPARADLAAGRIDGRLLATLATLADIESLRVVAFGDSGPGAPAGAPLRSAEIAPPSAASAPAWTRTALRFLAAQQDPFLPSLTALARPVAAGWALLIEYPSPSPLGLLEGSGASPGA